MDFLFCFVFIVGMYTCFNLHSEWTIRFFRVRAVYFFSLFPLLGLYAQMWSGVSWMNILLTGSVLSFLSSAILRMLSVMSGEARPKLTSRGQPTTVLRREGGTVAYKMEDVDGSPTRRSYLSLSNTSLVTVIDQRPRLQTLMYNR